MKNLFIFLIGFIGYGLIEILWRGYTHISMLFTGGICLLLIWYISALFSGISKVKKALLSALAITAVEFFVGALVNVYMKLGVWDYSRMKYNMGGQICLFYTILWFILSYVLIRLCDIIQQKLF